MAGATPSEMRFLEYFDILASQPGHTLSDDIFNLPCYLSPSSSPSPPPSSPSSSPSSPSSSPSSSSPSSPSSSPSSSSSTPSSSPSPSSPSSSPSSPSSPSSSPSSSSSSPSSSSSSPSSSSAGFIPATWISRCKSFCFATCIVRLGFCGRTPLLLPTGGFGQHSCLLTTDNCV